MRSVPLAPHVAQQSELVPEAARNPVKVLRVSSQWESAELSVATLFADPHRDRLAQAVQASLSRLAVTIDLRSVPASLARSGTAGRISVPHAAAQIVQRQGAVLGAGFGGDPLTPIARLWRGLQRRADVLVDVRQCTTLSGSDAERAGNQRDVLLVTQRMLDRSVRHSRSDSQSADRWTRARDSAEIVYRMAAAGQRSVLLVLPVGRGIGAQACFADALERHARAQRLPAPRAVKAGLLAALLAGARGDTRWLVASVMPIEELSQLVAEAIGDTGPWPVVSIGRGATFYDMPVASASVDDPVPMLLALVNQLQRSGRVTIARAMFDALTVTMSAEARIREELGGALSVPVDAFLRGVSANWGRAPIRVAITETGGRARHARWPSPLDAECDAPLKWRRTVA